MNNGRRVLVVDDEFLIRWSLLQTLSDHGYQVAEAGDARGAARAVGDAAETFDVVLLDLRLPDSEDLSLLASIRAHSPQTRVILMTAYGSPEVMRSALELGAFRVVSKPFDLQDVANLVGEATAGATH